MSLVVHRGNIETDNPLFQIIESLGFQRKGIKELSVLFFVAQGRSVGVLHIVLIHYIGSKYLTFFPIAVAYSISDLVLDPI